MTRPGPDAIFPGTTPLVSLMASFAAFASGYLARPIGGIVLSHYGDRHGRRRVFLWSVFVMSGATLGMGFVPDYMRAGAAASGLMVTLRLVQGFCLGGGLPGALTYVVETAAAAAPLVCGVVFTCVTMGVRPRPASALRCAPCSRRPWCRSTAGASGSSSAGLAGC
jgi:MFS family permease